MRFVLLSLLAFGVVFGTWLAMGIQILAETSTLMLLAAEADANFKGAGPAKLPDSFVDHLEVDVVAYACDEL